MERQPRKPRQPKQAQPKQPQPQIQPQQLPTQQPQQPQPQPQQPQPQLNVRPDNRDIANQLTRIADYYTQDGDTYRAKSYANAARAVANHRNILISGQQARQELKGIGESIAFDINQFITRGTIQRLMDLDASHVDRKAITDLFSSIYGIGPVIANRYFDQGFRTLEDLWARAPLTDAQRVGIMYRDHIPLRIPREEMDLINETLRGIFTAYDPNLEWMIAGSYRREEPDSGDVDILIKSKPGVDLATIVTLLKQRNLLPADLAQGPIKYLGIIRLSDQYNAHRLDIVMLPPAEWPYAVLYFTGSQKFNILARQRAIDLGLTLNEHGMKDNNEEFYPAETEEDIFDYLGLQYLTPVQRTKVLDAIPLAPGRQ